MTSRFLVLYFITTTIAVQGADYFELRDGLSNSRIVFEQTRRGRVVFLGGSITNMKGWKERVSDDLKRRFPKTQFEFINAGIPSTGSTPAAFRLLKDVFKNGRVDLLFEEAAVNDSTNGRSNTEQTRAMEGIVRHSRKLNPNIDIVIMHFVDPEKMRSYNQGKTPRVIQNHEKVAAHYKLPSINLALEVTERIQRNEFTWQNDFKNLHPSPFGHALYSKTIARCFDAAWDHEAISKKPTPYPVPSKLNEFCYDSGNLVSPSRAVETEGFSLNPKWVNNVGGGTRHGFVNVPMLEGQRPGDRFRFKFDGSAVGLFIASGPDAGTIEFKIDQGDWTKQDLYTKWSGGLHIPWLYVLAAELNPKKKHILHVRIAKDKNIKSKGHACRIVHLAVNGTD